MAIAWHLKRMDKIEASLAQQTLGLVSVDGALVPSLWYSEVANTLLFAERQKASTEQDSATFQADIAKLEIAVDLASPQMVMPRVLALGRAWKLAGYDATYLELVLRTGRAMATFDRQLAEAVRKAGGLVFGDAA